MGEVPIQPLRTILNHPTHRASEPFLPLGEIERSDGGAQCQRLRTRVSSNWCRELKKHSPLERGDRGAVGEVPIQPLRTILNRPTHRASEPCLPLGEKERSDEGAQCQRLRAWVSPIWRGELKKAFPSGGGFGARSFLFVECSSGERCIARAIRRSRHGASPYRRTVCASADCRGRKNTCAGVECGSKI